MVSYTFNEQASCLMCGTHSSENRVLGLRLNRRQGWKPRKHHGFAVTIRRCHSCGLTYPDPLPIPASINDHYAVPPEDYWTDDYFSIDEGHLASETSHASHIMGMLARATSTVNLHSVSSLKALDIGAAIGKGMLALDRAGFEAWGLEPSPTFRQMAIERSGIQADRLQLSSVEDAKWPDNHFNYITFGAVLEHLYNPALCLMRAMSWLRPGGIIHAEVPSSDYLLHHLLNGYYRLIGSSYVANLSPMHAPYHLYEFTPRSFSILGKNIGFEVAEFSYHPASGRFVPRKLYPFFYPLMKATNTGMQLTIYLRKL